MSMEKYLVDIQQLCSNLFKDVSVLITETKKKVSVFLNVETTMMFYSIGSKINKDVETKKIDYYGAKIVATMSQLLTEEFGKGFSYSALTRMCKVAKTFPVETIATLSQQLSWSHLIELSVVENQVKREFYIKLCVEYGWSIRMLRDNIDSMLFERSNISSTNEQNIISSLNNSDNNSKINPDLVFKNSYILDFLDLSSNYSEKDLENALVANIEKFILELGSGFSFIERQRRMSVDSVDYYLDLLFYHRKLKRLVAIELKLGKFKPQYKAQMELYLRWLEKYEMQDGEEKPIGLLLCSEGNTEHVELLMIDNSEIKIAQYLTELPSKEWFMDKLNRSLQIAQTNQTN